MLDRSLAAGLFLAVTTAVAPQAQAQAQSNAEAQFFKDKTVRIVVGYGAGGGFDTYARMIAPYLSKTLGATVIVENVPGAGGISALNRTAASAPDGLVLQLVNGTGAVLSQLVDVPAIRYDLLELSHLGTVSVAPWIWMVGPGSPVNTPADAQKPDLTHSWAASGPIDGLADGAAFVCEMLKLNCRIVIGYKGTNDAGVAVIRGEMDAIYISDTSANGIAKSGNARAVATIGRTRSRFFPSTPQLSEMVKLSPETAWMLDFRYAAEDLGRIIVAPPRMQPGRLAHLRQAIKETLADRALIAEAERTQRDIGYVDADQTLASIRKVLVEPSPSQSAHVKKIIARTQ